MSTRRHVVAAPLKQPEPIEVNRSQLRQKQSEYFRKARGSKVLLVTGSGDDDGKYVVDKEYFDQLVRKLEATIETLEITTDRRLFNQILQAADSLEDNLRLGKLHSLEDAFAED
jgi:hypothetical protein